MSALFEVEKTVSFPEKPCAQCRGFEFTLYQRGPHIGRTCENCGRDGGWVPRADLGLGKRSIKREEIPFDVRADVLQKWKHRCAWCGIPAGETPAGLYVGHIIPRAKVVALHGVELADNPLNLAPTCETCNAGAHLTDEYAVDLLLAALRLGAE